MKKVLIISYHSLPLDVVASHRTKAFLDYFFENGIKPTLITHHWKKDNIGNWKRADNNQEIEIEDFKTYETIRLPLPIELESPSSFFTTKHWFLGNFEIHLLNSYKIFKEFLFQHLIHFKYDLILAIYSPHYHLKLAFELNKNFDIPYILDFRDLWDNQIITKSYQPNFKKKIQDYIIKRYWKKWIDRSVFFSTTSEKWIDFLIKLTSKSGVKITNGHEITKLTSPEKTEKFTLAYFGRLYPYQNLDVIISAINLFLEKQNGLIDFQVLLIGIKKVGEFDGAEVFKSKIPNEYLKIIPYLSKEELFDYTRKNVSLFILPNLNEDNGSFFVKLYDYLALNKPIILAPITNSENDYIIQKLNAGLFTSSPSEIAEYLSSKYKEYKKNGYLSSLLEDKEVIKFHRANQVKKLSEHIYNSVK